MRELKPFFEIFIKVIWLLKGEHYILAALCKEIVKSSQKYGNKQGSFKINDKFANADCISEWFLPATEALVKEKTGKMRMGNQVYFNPFRYKNYYIFRLLLKDPVY